jgi:hypothetical protein
MTFIQNKRIPLLIIALLALLTSASKCFGQKSSNAFIEKVHLHIDKQSYAAGDTLWFKAYVVMAGNNELSILSKVLHVDFIDNNDKLIQSLMVPLSSGLAAGDIVLPDTLKEGRCRVRAYTNWMRNFGEESFFDRIVPIVNGFSGAVQRNSELVPTKKLSFDVQFFPESGVLINGLRSKVGVKITGSNGHGQQATGNIVDQNGTLVASFNTLNSGIGTFPLQPAIGSTYSASVKLFSGDAINKPLPIAKNEGYVLTINNREIDTINVIISSNAQPVAKNVLLVAWGDREVYYSTKIRLTGQRYKAQIPKAFLPPGVSRLTLMTAEDNNPLAERLIFVDDKDPVKLVLSNKGAQFKAGEKSVLNIKVTDRKNNGLRGSFSMAAINLDKASSDDDEELTIGANLLLISDLKGYVERPNYYFTAKDFADSTERSSQLDNLLLTQGWRRFTRKMHDADSTRASQYLVEEGIKITGRLLGKNDKPVAGSKITAFAIINSSPFIKDALTDSDGKFVIDGIDFDNDVRFTIQAKDVKNKYDVKILIDTITAPEIAPLDDSRQETAHDTAWRSASKRRFNNQNSERRGVQLKEVAITVKKEVYSSNPLGRQSADVILEKDRLHRHMNLRNAIESADGTIRFGRDNEPKLQSMRFPTISTFITLMDGQRVSNDYLTLLDPKDIESIEIVKNGGSLGYLDQGVIVINSSKRDPNHDFSKDIVAGVRTLKLKGYTEVREFYMPKYDLPQGKPDIRDVVYWNPDIVPDDNGEAIVSFMNSGTKGSYQVIIEGITIDGRVGRSVLHYVLQ